MPGTTNLSAISIRDMMLPLLLSVILVVIYQFNFLLFHSLAEIFAVIVAIMVMVVAWYMYPFTRNDFLMYLGCGYIWIGMLDLMHTLAYQGMPLFNDIRGDMSLQYWVGTRFIEAFLLLSAPLFLVKKLDRRYALTGYMLISMGLIYLARNNILPLFYVEGAGLTTIKVISEYVIIALLFLAIIHLRRHKNLLEPGVFTALTFSIILTMLAELAFTFYISVYGFSNMVGHIFKIFSYWLIFLSVVRTTMLKPVLALSRSASTYDAIPDATIVVDKEGNVRQANKSACLLVGRDVPEIVGHSAHELFHPSNKARSHCPVCQNMQAPLDRELEVYDVEHDRWLSYTHTDATTIPVVNGMVEVIRDISSKIQSQEEYRKLSALKDSIVENLPIMLFVKEGKEHRYVEWNKAAEELTGVSRNEMIGRNDYDFWPREEAEFFISKDKEVLDSGEFLEIEQEPLSTKRGPVMLHTKKIPIYDDAGEASFLLGISEDITEKLKTEEFLRRSQKMDALGKLTGGIAHDYNNTLGIINGFADLIITRDLGHEKVVEFATQIKHAGERGVKLTRKLLGMSKLKPSVDSLVNINMMLGDERLMLERTLTSRIALVYDLGEDLWPVCLDASDLEDSIVNIAINAMHAINGSGDFTIQTRNIKLDDVRAGELEVQPGEYILVGFTDTGSGMDAETRARVFDPFFTSKGDAGTGLGLSQVYGFVQRSHGAITVSSEPGKGTTFELFLPRHGG